MSDFERIIIFVGGVHGAGKTTLCNKISRTKHYCVITASSLLKRHEKVVRNTTLKGVDNIDRNQDLIIEAFEKEKKNIKQINILLDGHFSLVNKSGCIVGIDSNVFIRLEINKFICVTADPIVIQQRLFARDRIEYTAQEIKRFQEFETCRAKKIAEDLHLPLFFIDTSDFESNQDLSNSFLEFI